MSLLNDPNDHRLVNVLDRLADRGVALRADLWLSVADVALVYVRLQAVIASPDKIAKPGVWGGRPAAPPPPGCLALAKAMGMVLSGAPDTLDRAALVRLACAVHRGRGGRRSCPCAPAPRPRTAPRGCAIGPRRCRPR
jgi:hypothetical protein